MKKISGGVTAPKGFQAAGIAAGIKKENIKVLQRPSEKKKVILDAL